MNAHTKSFKTALLIAALAMPMAVFADDQSDADNASSSIEKNNSKAASIITSAIKKATTDSAKLLIVSTAITNSPDLAAIITTAAIKAAPDLAADIASEAVKAAPNSAAAIISAAISAAPSSAKDITTKAISDNASYTNAIIAASVSSVTEQAAANSAVKGNEKSTEGATASSDVLKEVILAEFNAACPTIVASEACTAAATKAVKRAGAAANVDGFIDEIKVAVSAN
ncbi:MAG: hypothetical protein NTY69_07485 [Methylococcales bacterium]|nr:hypothetical protein [Methylococcales bacterium]